MKENLERKFTGHSDNQLPMILNLLMHSYVHGIKMSLIDITIVNGSYNYEIEECCYFYAFIFNLRRICMNFPFA